MFHLGDIVAIVGQSKRLLVVDVERGYVTASWKLRDGRVLERVAHQSAFVLLQRA